MKFELTRSFEADRARLTAGETQLVRERLPAFIRACERHVADPAAKWPTGLRVRDVEGAPGVWEVTFSFSGPDLRATFEWIDIDGTPGIRWRRIGGHSIFRRP